MCISIVLNVSLRVYNILYRQYVAPGFYIVARKWYVVYILMYFCISFSNSIFQDFQCKFQNWKFSIVARYIAKINPRIIFIKNYDLTRHQWYYYIYLKDAPHRVYITTLEIFALSVSQYFKWPNGKSYLKECVKDLLSHKMFSLHFKCFLYFTVAIKYVKDYLSSIMQHFSDVIENICSTFERNANECST